MMTNQRSRPLREQAMEALRESTTMLEVARNLLKQGNRTEAQRLQWEARNKRNVSVLLMAKANALDNATPGRMPSHYHELNISRAH
jgi:ribosome maturation protein Sdo1